MQATVVILTRKKSRLVILEIFVGHPVHPVLQLHSLLSVRPHIAGGIPRKYKIKVLVIKYFVRH